MADRHGTWALGPGVWKRPSPTIYVDMKGGSGERKEATSERDFQTWAIAREEGERLLKGQMSASLRGNRTCYVRA